jgi:hypothetical protein
MARFGREESCSVRSSPQPPLKLSVARSPHLRPLRRASWSLFPQRYARHPPITLRSLNPGETTRYARSGSPAICSTPSPGGGSSPTSRRPTSSASTSGRTSSSSCSRPRRSSASTSRRAARRPAGDEFWNLRARKQQKSGAERAAPGILVTGASSRSRATPWRCALDPWLRRSSRVDRHQIKILTLMPGSTSVHQMTTS